MKLYHGTAGKYLDAILQKGIAPRKTRNDQGNREKHPSNENAVYLTDVYAPYFSMAASQEDEHSAAIIEIDTAKLNVRNLVPDEDFLEFANRKEDVNCGLMELTERIKFYRERLPLWRNTGAWRVSVKTMGTCAYLGTIRPKAITRVVVVETKKDFVRLGMQWDAMINAMNYKFCGATYKQKMALLFGDPVAPPKDNDPIFTMFNPTTLGLDRVKILSLTNGKVTGIRIKTKLEDLSEPLLISQNLSGKL